MRALLIDDDRKLHDLLSRYFSGQEVRLICEAVPEQGLRRALHETFDVILLDIMMPGLDGLEVLRQFRTKSSVPVIMLTARGEETDRVVGLELGADDYLPKPFSPRELLARMRAVTRRLNPALRDDVISNGPLTANLNSRSAEYQQQPLPLTALEFDLLVTFMKRPARVISRQALLEETGRDDVAVGDRTVDVHIAKLRRKLEAAGGDDLIKTVRGVGYTMSRIGEPT